MSMNLDIRQTVESRLTIESLQILKEISQDRPDDKLGWFQGTIARAEEANQQARTLAATIVMKAYGEELMTMSFDVDRLIGRVRQGIQDMLQ